MTTLEIIACVVLIAVGCFLIWGLGPEMIGAFAAITGHAVLARGRSL